MFQTSFMTKDDIIPKERIASSIFYIRKKKVIFDRDLAELYDVETRQLKRAVRRNISRFPDDFMFELNKLELHNLRSHFGTSSWGGTRHAPMAFTEQGVAMLSSVLNSERAIQVNIQINRTFSRMRELLSSHEDIRRKIESMERRYDRQFKAVFDAIKQLLVQEEEPKRIIGFNENRK